MADILEEIIAHKQVELKKMKEILPLHDLAERVNYLLENCPNTKLSMRQSLAESSSGIIAEFKRRSPSKGWIKEEGEPTVIPPSYAENGAAALSILTDEKFFGGKLNFIQKDITILFSHAKFTNVFPQFDRISVFQVSVIVKLQNEDTVFRNTVFKQITAINFLQKI